MRAYMAGQSKGRVLFLPMVLPNADGYPSCGTSSGCTAARLLDNMNENTNSSANTDPQLLLESGPMLLRDFNPKGILRFTGRKCITCQGEIMDHWLRHADDPDLRAEYWCSREGPQFSQGIADPQWDVPEGFGR